MSYVMIEAANLWASYSRCLFISAALGARDSAGNRLVTTPAADESYAIDLAVHAIRPKLRGVRKTWSRQEQPDWQNKGHLAKAVKYIGAAIWPEVDAAVSYPSRVLQDLPTMRNFYAHKAERAAVSAMALGPRYGVTRRMSPHDLLCTSPPGASDVLVNEWLADLQAIFSLMP
ncbi:MAG: hypothetical protein ACJ757_08575 [Gaiellaceae bacterium]